MDKLNLNIKKIIILILINYTFINTNKIKKIILIKNE